MTNQDQMPGCKVSRPTLKTIADIAGLSVATVSRALANDIKIAKAIREKIHKVAGSLGYVPDRAAQRLRTGKAKVISLILDPHQEVLGFENSLILGLTNAQRATNWLTAWFFPEPSHLMPGLNSLWSANFRLFLTAARISRMSIRLLAMIMKPFPTWL